MDFCAGLDSTLYTAEDLMSENLHIPENITHAQVDADPILKRLQQDLIVLTSFRDNETLHWRPTWFPQEPFAERFWTLHNPPNVVTEYCGPSSNKGNTPFDFTRRMRREDDPQPLYVKSWEQWDRYCESCGVPKTFLNNDMVNLIRLGLQRDEKGQIMGI
jgi:hypothetical protein